MKQGDVCWYTFKQPDKRRPVLILTCDSAIPVLISITVAPLTSTIRGIPSEVYLNPDDDGVLDECVVNTDNIQTVLKELLSLPITCLSTERLNEVRAAVSFSLGLDE